MELLNHYLQIPERCLLSRRITKAFFKRNFDLTISEKGLLDNTSAFATITWLASINPGNANVPAFSESQMMFEELQVITVEMEETDFSVNYPKFAELIQKHIPYSILLALYNKQSLVLNTCNKVINQNDVSRRIIEKRFFSQEILVNEADENQSAFLKSLTFANLDKTNLKTLYEGYTERIINLQTAGVTGVFEPRPQYRTRDDLKNLELIDALRREISDLQNKAKKETQLREQVNINTQIHTKRKEIERLTALVHQV